MRSGVLAPWGAVMLVVAACDPAPTPVVAESAATSSAHSAATSSVEASSSVGSHPSARPASKKDECAALVRVINAGLEKVEKVQTSHQKPGSDPSGTGELRAMATVMDESAANAGKLSLGAPDLKALGTRYEAMTKAIAKHARGVAEAADKKDFEELTKVRLSLDAAIALEDPIVDELNLICKE